jgi:HrpA-like RNA helicase
MTLLSRANILYVEGRQYGVRVFHTVDPQPDYLDSALTTVFQCHLENPAGDILVFLTGAAFNSLAL